MNVELKSRRSVKKRKLRRIILLTSLIAAIIISLIGYNYYSKILKPNVVTPDKSECFIYIYSGSTLSDITKNLIDNKLLINNESFEWVAIKKNYPNKIKAGRYKIRHKMNNNQLVNLLRSGKQEPLNLVFNNIRTIEQLSGRIAQQIEADSLEILNQLKDSSLISNLGFTKETIPGMFIPNTYQFYWNTTSKKFIARMKKEHNRFWNDERLEKAKKLDLSANEVSTLASIIAEETSKYDEMPRIAGVYLNRLKRRIPLQADPTVRFALGDFTIKRILNIHLEINSPYNTYKKYGLPPGPIRLPSIKAIDAVLNPEKHSYLYFCAKEDFSGYHNFAKTLRQHNKNARKYQRALNKLKIYR